MTDQAEKISPNILVSRQKTTSANWTVWHLGAGLGLLGGFLILFGAGFLSVFEYFSDEKLHGSWLFFLALPLCIFGAHCFDKIDTAERSLKSRVLSPEPKEVSSDLRLKT